MGERRKLERKGLSIIKITYAGKSMRDWKNATTNVQIYILIKSEISRMILEIR